MQEVRYCFAQPESIYESVLCHTFTLNELERADKEIANHVTLALSGKGWLEPSEVACKWCDAKSICPALQHKIESYKDVHITSEEFNDMTPVERGHHIKKAKEAAQAANLVYDALKEKTKDMITKDPESIGGWYMARGREINSVTSVNAAMRIAKDLGIPTDEFISKIMSEIKTKKNVI